MNIKDPHARFKQVLEWKDKQIKVVAAKWISNGDYITEGEGYIDAVYFEDSVDVVINGKYYPSRAVIEATLNRF